MISGRKMANSTRLWPRDFERSLAESMADIRCEVLLESSRYLSCQSVGLRKSPVSIPAHASQAEQRPRDGSSKVRCALTDSPSAAHRLAVTCDQVRSARLECVGQRILHALSGLLDRPVRGDPPDRGRALRAGPSSELRLKAGHQVRALGAQRAARRPRSESPASQQARALGLSDRTRPSHTSSQRSASPPSTSLIASITTNGASSSAGMAQLTRRPAAAPRDGRFVPGRASAAGSSKTIAAIAARSSCPSGWNTASPKRSRISGSVGLPGIRRLAGEDVGVDHRAAKLAEHPRHGRLAAADRPGDPDQQRPSVAVAGSQDVHRGACSASTSHASSAWARAASTSASSLDTRRSSTKLAWTPGVAQGQLELALAQPEARQVLLDELPAAAIGVLGQHLARPRVLGRAGCRCSAAMHWRAWLEPHAPRRRDGRCCRRGKRARRPSSLTRRLIATPGSRRRTAPPGAAAPGAGCSTTHSSRAHALEQPPVVRDDDHRRRRLAQERLECLARRDVEVVRGLVEQQQVGRRDADDAPARGATALRRRASRRA